MAMRQHRTTRRYLLALVVLVRCGSGTSAGTEPDPKDTPKPLPPEIVKEWRDAGAEVGWMRVNQNGVFAFQQQGAAGAIPAVRFAEWKRGALAKLPDPGVAFGLDVNGTEITDADLKGQAAFKSLQVINLQKPQITDVGLKSLAGLKSLQSLNLFGAQVTDTELKELAGIKELQALFLHETRVTDAGLKELAAIESLQVLGLAGTAVTDAALKELAKLKSLRSQGLKGAKVTDAGVAALQKELPECTIQH
jgi:internalin A